MVNRVRIIVVAMVLLFCKESKGAEAMPEAVRHAILYEDRSPKALCSLKKYVKAHTEFSNLFFIDLCYKHERDESKFYYPLVQYFQRGGYEGPSNVNLVIEDSFEADNRMMLLLTALQIACDRGNKEVVEILLEAGANPNLKFRSNNASPLKITLLLHAYEIAALLIQKGACCSDYDQNGYTALHTFFQNYPKNQRYNAFENHPEMFLDLAIVFEELLKYATPELLNAKDAKGVTPLMLAFQTGRYDFAEKMINRGASLAVADNYGTTPLMYACFYTPEGVIFFRERVDFKDELGKVDKEGRTAMHYAVLSKKLEAVKAVLEN